MRRSVVLLLSLVASGSASLLVRPAPRGASVGAAARRAAARAPPLTMADISKDGGGADGGETGRQRGRVAVIARPKPKPKDVQVR